MKILCLLTVTILMFIPRVGAQNPDCRQSWMPPDVPAFCAWDTEPAMPEARTYPAVSASGKNIFVLGGFRYDSASGKVIYYDSVASSAIGADGHLSPWKAEPPFKTARSGTAVAVS